MENLVQSPSHYVWEVAGKPVSIHLEFNVVDRLGMDVMRGFGAIPKRGAEVGGLLIGSIERGKKLVVKIEDFVPVVCDYLRGPSYVLTKNDEARFRDAVQEVNSASRSGRRLVGIYRSHTREALGLADEDLELFNMYCGSPEQIILLVRPFAARTSVGAFFFQESNGFRRESSYQEFPFRRRDLGGGASTSIRSTGSELPALGSVPEEESGPDLREWVKNRGGEVKTHIPRVEKPKPPVQMVPSRLQGRWVWIPLSFIFLTLGVVVGFQSALILNKGTFQKSSANPVGLDLVAKPENGKIVVRWDRSSPSIQDALSGSLRIMAGEFSKMVKLDSRQLQNGSVIYMDSENKVSFRLEVVTRRKTTIGETVDYNPARR